MRPLARLLSLSILLLAAGATAQAQVAVPSLVPTQPRIGDPVVDVPTASFVTPNPAAMQWGSPSKWGFGQIKSSRQQTSPTTGSTVEFSGLYLGFRKVDKSLSLAAELLELSDDTNAVLEADWSVLNGAVAFQSGDSIAFGVGADRTSTSNNANSLEYNALNLGMSFEVKTNMFIGFAIGTEDIHSSFDGDDTRGVQKLGFGYRKGGTANTHFEIYAVEKAEGDNLAAEFTDVSELVGVAEFNISDLLLAASYATTERKRIEQEGTIVTVDLGWAPKNGLTVVFHQEQTTTKITTVGFESETDTDTTAISVGYQF